MAKKETREAPEKREKNEDKKGGSGLALGMALGMVIGAAIGSATGNIALWLPVGMCLGMSFGLLFRSGEDEEDEESADAPVEDAHSGDTPADAPEDRAE